MRDATNNANHTLKVLDSIRKGINVGADLVVLGTAIIAGNPEGIVQATAGVIGVARTVVA